MLVVKLNRYPLAQKIKAIGGQKIVFLPKLSKTTNGHSGPFFEPRTPERIHSKL